MKGDEGVEENGAYENKSDSIGNFSNNSNILSLVAHCLLHSAGQAKIL